MADGDPHSPLLDLPDGSLLSVLQHVDGLAVLRLSLCSHAAARRLGGITDLWRDLTHRTLVLPLPPPPPLSAASRTPRPPYADAGDGISSGDAAANGTRPEARLGGSGSAVEYDSSSGGGGEGRRYWAALKAHARLAFWHGQHCLRLARALGSPPAPQPQDGAWRAPPRAAVRVARLRLTSGAGGAEAAAVAAPDAALRADTAALFNLSDADLYGLRACDGSDICVSGLTSRSFSVRATPSGAPCRLLVVAAWRGRPLAWLYFAALPSRPSWQDQGQYYSQLGHPHQPQQLHHQQERQGPHPGSVQNTQQDGVAGGAAQMRCGAEEAPAGPHLSGGAAAVAPAALTSGGPALPAVHAQSAEVWCCPEALSAASRDGGGVAASTTAEVAAAAAAAVRLLAAAGRERLRCVTAVSITGRRRLSECGLAADLAALRDAGVVVVDLAGILPRPGFHPGSRPESLFGGGDVVDADEVMAGEAQARGLRCAAAVDGGGGGDARASARLREAVSQLPRAAPGVQVLVLPVVMPRGGRAGIRTTPSRGGGGAKCTAPRLLQLMVPVLSELRLAMTAQIEAEAVRPPELPQLQRVVLVMEEGDEGPQAAALRNLAVATLDRATGRD